MKTKITASNPKNRALHDADYLTHKAIISAVSSEIARRIQANLGEELTRKAIEARQAYDKAYNEWKISIDALVSDAMRNH